MDNVLDILCDYCLKGKEVDFKFFKYVFDILKVGNEEYVEKIKRRHYYGNLSKSVHVPMAYSYLSKEIFIHPKQISGIHNVLHTSMNDNWSDLEKIFLYNTYLLFDLMHEFEHVYQFDELLNPNSSIESKLLGLTHFAYAGIFKESKFSQFLISNFGLYINDDLGEIYFKLGYYNKLFGSEVLYERLADIYACQKVNDLLEKVDADIDRVKSFFDISSVQYLLTGYDEEQSILFPTVRYIKNIKALEIPELNEYVRDVVIPSIALVTNTYDRFKYGLYVTEEEISDLKKILI